MGPPRLVITLLVLGACVCLSWQQRSLNIKGVDLFPFNSTVLSSAAMLAELDEIVATGANTVAVNFMLAQDNETSNVVYESPEITPSFPVLAAFIAAAHSRHLAVLLKPVVVCGNDACIMINITPSDPQAWFDSYQAYMYTLGSFAQSLQVEYLSVGLEFIRMTMNPIYLSFWRSYITGMRTWFHGQLTYCSIFYPYETQRVGFWDLLDFISMDTYVPLMAANATSPPSITQMQATFSGYMRMVDNWLQLQPSNVSSLPIVISEIGYPSSIAGLMVPSADPAFPCTGTSAPNPGLQAAAFQAYFDVAASVPWLQGTVIFWFDNPSSSDYYPNRHDNGWACGWTPRGKPAEITISKAFKKGYLGK